MAGFQNPFALLDDEEAADDPQSLINNVASTKPAAKAPEKAAPAAKADAPARRGRRSSPVFPFLWQLSFSNLVDQRHGHPVTKPAADAPDASGPSPKVDGEAGSPFSLAVTFVLLYSGIVACATQGPAQGPQQAAIFAQQGAMH